METPTHRHCAGSRSFLVMAAFALLSMLSALAMAHGNETHAAKGPHGGVLRTVDLYHLELLVGNGQARVWITDQAGSPRSTAGATGTLRVLSAAAGFVVKLAPANANEMAVNDNRIQPQEGLKLQLNLNLPGEKPLQSRFAIGDLAKESSHAVRATEHKH